MTHTPGPWVPHFSPETGWSVWHDPRQHGDMRTGAIIVASGIGPQATSLRTHKLRKANATLIAAAPDLLTACLDALAVEIEAGFPDSELASRLRAAIAKATATHPPDSKKEPES